MPAVSLRFPSYLLSLSSYKHLSTITRHSSETERGKHCRRNTITGLELVGKLRLWSHALLKHSDPGWAVDVPRSLGHRMEEQAKALTSP